MAHYGQVVSQASSAEVIHDRNSGQILRNFHCWWPQPCDKFFVSYVVVFAFNVTSYYTSLLYGISYIKPQKKKKKSLSLTNPRGNQPRAPSGKHNMYTKLLSLLLFFFFRYFLTDSFFLSKNLLISSSEHSYERFPRYTVYGGLLGSRLRSICRACDARGADGSTLRSNILFDGFSPGQLVVISNGKKIQHRDLFRGWGAQGFPTPEVDFPSLEFLKCT